MRPGHPGVVGAQHQLGGLPGPEGEEDEDRVLEVAGHAVDGARDGEAPPQEPAAGGAEQPLQRAERAQIAAERAPVGDGHHEHADEQDHGARGGAPQEAVAGEERVQGLEAAEGAEEVDAGPASAAAAPSDGSRRSPSCRPGPRPARSSAPSATLFRDTWSARPSVIPRPPVAMRFDRRRSWPCSVAATVYGRVVKRLLKRFWGGCEEREVAEREGFEPSRQVNPAHAISSRAP